MSLCETGMAASIPGASTQAGVTHDYADLVVADLATKGLEHRLEQRPADVRGCCLHPLVDMRRHPGLDGLRPSFGNEFFQVGGNGAFGAARGGDDIVKRAPLRE